MVTNFLQSNLIHYNYTGLVLNVCKYMTNVNQNEQFIIAEEK